MAATGWLRTLADRWALLAWCAVVAAVVACLPKPPDASELRGAPFAATVTLIRHPGAAAPGVDPDQSLELAAGFADRLDVARIAAARLGGGAVPERLAPTVDARADRHAGTVLVTARADGRDAAVAAAQAFGAATATYLQDAAGVPLQVIGSTTVLERGWLHVPTTRPGRAAAGAGAGLGVGLLLALTTRRRDHARLSGTDGFEAAYGAPVVAEVPRLHGSVRQFGDIAVAFRPNGAVAEAYRGLRSAVLGAPGMGAQGGLHPPLAHVVAVTSPRPEDGRSTVVANLAAALAEAGRSVLVIDADFGHPTVHLYLGTPPYTDPPQGPGLSELLQAAEPAYGMAASLRTSVVPGVGLITAGRGGRLPTSVLLGMPAVMAEARRCADVVLLDCPPALSSQDAVDLLQHASTVFVTGRPGRTSASQARRTRFVISRAGVRIAGVVVVGTGRDRDVNPTYAVAAQPDPAPSSLPQALTSGQTGHPHPPPGARPAPQM